MLDLSHCPAEIAALDSNAAALWPIFLRKAGIPIGRNGTVLEGDGTAETETRLAWIIRNLAVPSLLQRLAGKKDEVARALVWWRESVACSAGDSDIPDMKEENCYLLNPFIVAPELKFADPRAARLAMAREQEPTFTFRGRPRKTEEEKRACTAARVRRFRAAKRLENGGQPSAQM